MLGFYVNSNVGVPSGPVYTKKWHETVDWGPSHVWFNAYLNTLRTQIRITTSWPS